MNIKLLPLIILLTPIIAACTPGQINEAIEACKGDPACFEIVDSAIEEELAARGITGGKMTNVEMNDVKNFLEGFTLGLGENQFNYDKSNSIYQKNYYTGNLEEYTVLLNSMENLMDDFYDRNNTQLVPNLNVFNLDLVNPDFLQLFNTGTGFNRVKHLMYKVGNDVFNYEIYGEQDYIFNIHLELESIFFRDKRYISPVAIYDYFNENYSWTSVFNPNPLILEESHYRSAFFLKETDQGIYLTQNGIFYYMKDDPLYALDVPMLSKLFISNNQGTQYEIGIGFSGGYDNWNIILSFRIYGMDTDYITTKVLANISYKLDESMIGKDLVLQDWFNYALDNNPLDSELLSYTKASLLTEFSSIFSDDLLEPFILDAIVY